MARSATPSPLMATLFDPESLMLDDHELVKMLMLALYGISNNDGLKIPREELVKVKAHNIFCESVGEVVEKGNIRILRFLSSEIETAQTEFKFPKKGSGKTQTTPPENFLIVGSLKFCESVLRFLALSEKDKYAPWGPAFIDSIKGNVPYTYTWAVDGKSGATSFISKNMDEVISKAQADFAAQP